MKNNIPIFGMAKKYLNPNASVAYKTTVPLIITGTAIAMAGAVMDSKKVLIIGSLMSVGNLLFLKSRTK